MLNDSTIRSQRARSYLPKLLAALILAGGLSGCGSNASSKPYATAKFCNHLIRSGSDFTAYLSINGQGTSEYWTAYTGSANCTPCRPVAAGETLAFELGEDDTGDWIERFNKVLEINGDYLFSAEIDDSTNLPSAVSYRPNPGYTCETMGS
jgi:hypothetical protein